MTADQKNAVQHVRKKQMSWQKMVGIFGMAAALGITPSVICNIGKQHIGECAAASPEVHRVIDSIADAKLYGLNKSQNRMEIMLYWHLSDNERRRAGFSQPPDALR